MDGRTLRHRGRKPELLAAVTEYALDNGLGDASLRTVAHALGVSHATLLRHFSSKERLFEQVEKHLHAAFRAQISENGAINDTADASEFFLAVWEHVSQPSVQRQYFLLFETVGRKIRQPAGATELADAVIGDWIAPIEERLIRLGWPPEEASEISTLMLGIIRGLQLDLIVTEDKSRVDRAFARAVESLIQPRGL